MSQNKQRPPFPIFLFIGGGFLLLVAGFLLAMQNVSPVAPNVASHEEETHPEIARVSLAEAKSAFDAKQARFVDVRSADSFAQKRIVGAINIPLAELEVRVGELDPNEWIITYCT
ncbi:MAG: hypothetical protein LC099_00530 [Anaerolineales bacterium]|nr:hypothetical protein [Anaerolineales bacterium]